jgi:uncharacterized lipoprotein YajG
MIIDLERAHVFLGVCGLLLGFFASAASGVLATANHVVPPIAQIALKPTVDRLEAADIRLEATIAKVERDGEVRDQQNMADLREQMRSLEGQLREASRVTSEFLLQMARERQR